MGTARATWTVTTSPGRTGLGQRRSRMPGETPSAGTVSPRAVASLRRASRQSIRVRMQTQTVCQPEAQSEP